MSGVPYTFGTATTSIPLSNLDSNFVTPVTIGNASVALGNTISTIGNLTLNNVTINSGTINASVTETYTLANAVVYSNSSNVGVTSANLTFDGSTLTTLNSAYTGTLTGGTGIVNLGSGQFYKDASGNVGIGTSSPSVALTIQSSGEGFYLSRDGGNAPDIRLRQSRGTFASKTISVNGDLTGQLHFEGYDGSAYLDVAFIGGVIDGVVSAGVVPTAIRFATGSTTPAERMRINSSGSLLVGTTATPSSSQSGFSVDSFGMLMSVPSGNINAAWYKPSSPSNGTIHLFVVGGSTVGSISTSGGVTLYNTTSDYRLKTVIGSVADAGQRIDALQPIEYDWNSGGRTRGFLAHQFAEVYPNSVSGEKDAIDEEGKPVYQSMQASTSEVMADLIAEIQSLRKRIATLESK